MTSLNRNIQELPQLGTQAQACFERRYFQQALDLYLRMLAIDSTNPSLWNAAGVCFQEMGQTAKAIEFYLHATLLDDRDAGAYNNLAVALLQEGDAASAIDHLEHALRLDPQQPNCCRNLGIAYRQQLDYEKSAQFFRRAAGQEPDSAAIVGSLGEILSLVYRDDAESFLRRALALSPGDPERHWNLAIDLLKQGNYLEGWYEYEWRLKRALSASEAKWLCDRPVWNGDFSLLPGKSLLIRAEQGFGDTIQFTRYLPSLLHAGANVSVEVQPPLRRWMSRLAEQFDGRLKVLGRGDPLPGVDFCLPMMSLPFVFGTTLDTVPPAIRPSALPCRQRDAQGKRISTPAPPEISSHGSMRLSQSGPLQPGPLQLGPNLQPGPNPQPDTDRNASGKIPHRHPSTCRIGLAWAGNPHHERDRERSIPLSVLAPVFQVPGCEWVSLQQGEAAMQIAGAGLPPHLHLETPALEDFTDTASILDDLDLVLSVDTAVAHLSATHGVPTWILVPFVADWRWLQPNHPPSGQTGNPWYPTARIYRPAAPPLGCASRVSLESALASMWQETIAQVVRDLRQFVP